MEDMCDSEYSDGEEEPSEDEAGMDFLSDGEGAARAHHAQPTRWQLIDTKQLAKVQARLPPAAGPLCSSRRAHLAPRRLRCGLLRLLDALLSAPWR